ncbi:unannotated protein [freshwater metagenome]|uniref:Unannotated protein n=1 Tax=freshwater metagenome TaxID=449393 RepID=A0A6J7HJN8_9ZZZZ
MTDSFVSSYISSAIITCNPMDIDFGAVMEAAGTKRFGYREVRVWKVDVLTNQTNVDFMRWAMNVLKKCIPAGPVNITER